MHCVCPPAGDASSETDKVAADRSAAVGSAMGMLTSLTSVVQSTVSSVYGGKRSSHF